MTKMVLQVLTASQKGVHNWVSTALETLEIHTVPES